MSYSEILFSADRGVATVTLNRPDRLNAWTPTMGSEVRDAMVGAAEDKAIRAIILTGAGRGFCAGADMANLSAISSGTARKPPPFTSVDPEARADFQHPMTWLPAIGKPVIAAINGAAAGMGFSFMLFCDLRFAADNATFVTAFARRGLIAEHGMSWMLSRLCGHSRALDLTLSSRRVSAEEAYRIGLADRIFPAADLMAQTQAYARDIAENVSPRSTRIMKRQLWQALMTDLKTAMDEADHEMALSLKGDDFKEGVAHFLEKRPPRFTGH
ncbi:MAG: enoyl-CoA hydratase [Terricaulis sp.]